MHLISFFITSGRKKINDIKIASKLMIFGGGTTSVHVAFSKKFRQENPYEL